MTDLEQIIALAKHHCFGCDAKGDHWHFDEAGIEAFFHAVQAIEREACAKVCDEQHDRARTSSGAHRADACAAAIRNRGTT